MEVIFEFDIEVVTVAPDFEKFKEGQEAIYSEMIRIDPEKYEFLKSSKKGFELQEVKFRKRFNQRIITRMNGFDELGLAMKKHVEETLNCLVHAVRITKLERKELGFPAFGS